MLSILLLWQIDNRAPVREMPAIGFLRNFYAAGREFYNLLTVYDLHFL